MNLHFKKSTYMHFKRWEGNTAERQQLTLGCLLMGDFASFYYLLASFTKLLQRTHKKGYLRTVPPPSGS